MLNNNEDILLRYTEDGHGWGLTVMEGPIPGPALPSRGQHDTQPQWLRLILDVARVGGHIAPVPHPPPIMILWFVIDAACNLKRFYGWGDQNHEEHVDDHQV